MMTRKDYIETAKILADSREALFSLGNEGEDILDNLVADFVEMFVKDNERFNPRIFYSAVFGEDN